MYRSFPINSLDPVIAEQETVIFLDTARPADGQRYSLLFINPLRIYRCRRGVSLGRLLKQVSEESKIFWIAGYLAYEAGYWLEEKFIAQRGSNVSFGSDLLWLGIYSEPFIFDHCTGRWNRPLPPYQKDPEKVRCCNDFSVPEISHQIKKQKYFQELRKIRSFIAAGDVYQVNFTYDVSVRSSLQPWTLYKELRAKQPVPFGSFIRTHDAVIASFSPELFFLRQGNRIRVQPMKGTAPRGRFSEEDAAIARKLASDPKNRSENIMIVDLLRNDLGKICAPGSIAAKRIFEVERLPTVHQMTSTIEGRLRKRVDFSDTLRSLFPCGSVTGAPKIRAMEIIGDLEKGKRAVYCGAIGYSSPKGRAVFSVPIRTLQRNAVKKLWQYRVGSGIVWDSSAEEEWRECRDKCGFLTARRQDYRLFESLLFSKGTFLYLREHRLRLFDSARYFDFVADKKTWDRTILAIQKKLAGSKDPNKVRIFLDKNGVFSWDAEPIIAGKTDGKAIAVISDALIDPANPFLFHKTTIRPWYDKSGIDLRRGRCFDVIHLNTRGELTECTRSNLFVQINGVLYTPPVECGLLPGVLRAHMLKSGKCKERILFPKDIKKAETIYCGNSIRGLVAVEVMLKKRR
ncbi:MAG: aminodeoxychorismate synthase component I [Chitinispirillaceae bacterium]